MEADVVNIITGFKDLREMGLGNHKWDFHCEWLRIWTRKIEKDKSPILTSYLNSYQVDVFFKFLQLLFFLDYLNQSKWLSYIGDQGYYIFKVRLRDMLKFTGFDENNKYQKQYIFWTACRKGILWSKSFPTILLVV